MADFNTIDARAAALLADAAERQIADINRYLVKKLLEGVKVDTRFLTATVTELRRLVDTASREAVAGEYRAQIVAAAKGGRTSGEEAVGESDISRLDLELVKLALFNTEIKIKDLATPAIKIVNDIFTAAMVSGASSSKIADQVAAGLGGLVAMSRARAELIAHSELLSIFRQSQITTGQRLGFDLFQYLGPKDSQTEPVCKDALEVISTLDQWQSIDPIIVQYGLHYGCRHELVPVMLADRQAYQKKINGITITAYREAK